MFKDYKGDPDFKSASAFDPSPANIDKLTLRKKLDLPNGPVQLALLPKATRGNRVQAQMQIQFGTAQDLRGQRVNAAAVADQLNRGTAKLSRQDIQDRLDKLQAELGFSGSGTTLRIAMSTKGENLPELTTLALDIVRNANFPKDQLEEYQRQLETSIRNAMTEPSALASRALARQDNPWPADDLRYVPTFDEALASARGLNRDALAKFHARFYGAGNIEYSAVGDFQPEAIEKAIKAGLAGWKRAPAYERVANPYREIAAQHRHRDARQGQRLLPVAHAAEAAGQRRRLCGVVPGQLPVRRLGNLAPVEPRARNRRAVLQRAQLAVGVGVRAERLVEHLRHLCAAEPRAPGKAVGEELARVLKDGFSDKEISDGITALLNYRNLARAQDDVVAGVWLDYLERGRTFAWSADMDKKISALTPDVVNAAMRNICARTPSAPPSPATSRKSGALTHNRGGLARPAAAIQPLPRQGLFWRAAMMRRPACPHGAAHAATHAGAPPPAGSPTAGQAAEGIFPSTCGAIHKKEIYYSVIWKMFSTNTGLSQVG